MQGYLPRLLEPLIQRKLSENPVVAMIGPRQCGKSTLAAQIVAGHSGTVHLADFLQPLDGAFRALAAFEKPVSNRQLEVLEWSTLVALPYVLCGGWRECPGDQRGEC